MFRFRKWRLAKAAALCAILTIITPASLMAQETDELGDISLSDLLNLKISVATMTKTSVQAAPSIVSVITADEIRNMGARNLIDVLRTVPGFEIVHNIVGPSSKIAIRGMDSSGNNKLKLMLNGHALNFDSGSVGPYFKGMPVANIRQIEIIRGPGSALYGAGAFVGVINVITEEGGDKPSKIALEGGSYDTVRPYGELSYKNKDFKAYLYADYYTTEGYDGVIESDMASNSSVFASAAPGEMSSSDRHYTFQTHLSYKDLYFSGYLQKADTEIPVGVARALTDEDEMDSMLVFGELGYKLPLKDKGHLLFKTYYDYSYFDNMLEIFPEETAELPAHTGFPPGEGLYGNPNARQSVTGAEIMADYEVSSGIQLVAGASYEYLRQYDIRSYANYNTTGAPLEIDGITYPRFPYQYLGGMADLTDIANYRENADRAVTAVYGQGISDLKRLFSLEKGVKSLSLTAGVRYDNYDDIGDTVNPRFGLVYAPTDRLYFKVLYGTAFRAPSFAELYAKNNPTNVGNKELNPEKITTLEGLVGYDFTKKIRSSLTFFNVRSKDLIQRVASTVPGKPGSFENIGEIESSGAEAEIRFSFDRLKYAYCNFTWQDVKNTTHGTTRSGEGQVYTQEDFFPGSIPEFYGNIGVNYDFFNEHVIANVSLNYVGERERSEEMKWSGETLVRGDQRDPVKARTLVNASLTFRNFWKGWEFQLSGFNLFNADHRDPDSNGGLKYDMPQPERWIMAEVSYSF